QHPYIRELSLNMFNPGSGSIIMEALLALQQKAEYSDLRYDVRLFSSDPDSPSLGEAIESMLRPETTINEAADAFATSTGSHLFSKLKIAKRGMAEFYNSPTNYPAHISILLDVFPAEELAVEEKPKSPIPLYGLIQDFEVEFVDNEFGTYWNKSPII